MRIAIISDSHDNLQNIYKVLDWMNKNGVSEIIHCGDVCAPSALQEIAQNFNGKIHLVYGNVDGDHEGMKKIAKEAGNVIIYGDCGELEIRKNGKDGKEGGGDKFQILNQFGKLRTSFKFQKNIKDRIFKGDGRKDAGKKIAFCHFPFEARKLAESGKYDYVFYGHDHKPWEEKIGDCKMINPGTLAGMFYKATFAMWDVEKDEMELKLLELM